MTPEELSQLIAIGHEQRGVEFKGPGPRTDTLLFARVAKAVLAMANRRDGGLVVVGVEDNDKTLTPTGLAAVDVVTWNFDDVVASLAPYADPYVSVATEIVTLNAAALLVIEVAEFDEVPILCAKAYDPVLRKGACYVRTRRMPETTEIATQTEFRELLDLAIEKGVRRFVSRARGAGLDVPSTTSDGLFFDAELGGFP